MNVIEISKSSVESFDYTAVKEYVSCLGEQPIKNKGTLVIRFPELEADTGKPPFLDKFLRGWYMGLRHNIPNLLYFLADELDGKRQWTDVQFAMMMFGDIKVTSTNPDELSFEVKIHEEIFQGLIQNTAEYMVEVSKEETVSEKDKAFFSHIIFDYTNGFHHY